MTLDMAVMRRLHEQSLQATVVRHLGVEGQSLAELLADRLPAIHNALDVDLLPEGLFAFASPTSSGPLPGFSSVLGDLSTVSAYPRSAYTVEVLENGYRVKPAATDPKDFPAGSVGYSFSDGPQERWHVANESQPVLNPTPDSSTVFGTLVFTDLDCALDEYAQRKVRDCRCTDLEAGWLDESRVYWRQRPEIQVRRSVENFLVSRLRAVVEVEHIVDEDKEVDVVAFWSSPMRGALIECKWLGVSASEPDDAGNRKITRFGPSTARAGLAQLADYLDRKQKRSGERSFKGYLVVIDGRRKGAKHPDNGRKFVTEELLKYEHEGVTGWDSGLLARTDLATPRVMFCRPKV